MTSWASRADRAASLAVTRPTFLLIGAQKAGTTWLAEMLSQHPEVGTPSRKELHHFDLRANLRRGPESYLAHFDACHGYPAVGEATPNYLGVLGAPPEALDRLAAAGVDVHPHPEVVCDPAAEIHAVLPDLRLVVVLRDPVARAISSWRHQIRLGELSPRLPFREACGRHGIVTMGFYHHHLSRWLQRYGADRFLVHVYEEDVVDDPERAIRRTYEHLGVDPEFAPTGAHRRANERAGDLELHLRAIRPGLANRLVRAVPRLREIDRPRIRPTDDDLALLADVYRDDVVRLEALLGRSLDAWTGVPR